MTPREIFDKIDSIPEPSSFDCCNIATINEILKPLLPANPTVLEIGTWLGRSAASWIISTGASVFTIDKNPDTQATAKRLLTELGIVDKVTFILGDSQKMKPEPNASQYDVVWIDGAHDHDAVEDDLKNWVPLAKVLACGHDYCRAFPGVIQAVDEYFGKENVQSDGNFWWVLNPQIKLAKLTLIPF